MDDDSTKNAAATEQANKALFIPFKKALQFKGYKEEAADSSLLDDCGSSGSSRPRSRPGSRCGSIHSKASSSSSVHFRSRKAIGIDKSDSDSSIIGSRTRSRIKKKACMTRQILYSSSESDESIKGSQNLSDVMDHHEIGRCPAIKSRRKRKKKPVKISSVEDQKVPKTQLALKDNKVYKSWAKALESLMGWCDLFGIQSMKKKMETLFHRFLNRHSVDEEGALGVFVVMTRVGFEFHYHEELFTLTEVSVITGIKIPRIMRAVRSILNLGLLTVHEQKSVYRRAVSDDGKSMLPLPELEELLFESDSIQEVPERFEKSEELSLCKFALDAPTAHFREALRIKKAVNPEAPGSKPQIIFQDFQFFSPHLTSWTDQNFNQFIEANEKYGRHDTDRIIDAVEGKTRDEVMEYSTVFWEHCRDLENIDRILAQINRPKMSRIGTEYQVDVPYGLSPYDSISTVPYQNADKLLWSSYDRRVKDDLFTDEYLQSAPSTSDEQALYELVRCGYEVEEATRRRKFNGTKPCNTISLWTDRDSNLFQMGLHIFGKNFHDIREQMFRDRSIGELVEYYFKRKAPVDTALI